VAEIQRKQAVLGLNGRLTVQQCSFTNLDEVQAGPFESVFSNFGGLNCIADLTAVTKHLPRLLQPNGVLTWVIMPPICPWELLLTVKDWRVGTRRLRRGGVTAHVEGVPLQTYYFTPRQVRQALGSEFKLLELTALSLLTPTADNKTFARRYAQLYKGLVWLDERVSVWPLLNQMGDFFILTARYEPH
ncbi:MAG: hypothetical protein KDE51_13965, partial [Anaerolineales bacterium]|nr:hypothetical protein [Anaerolineales bacterium]